MNSLLIALALVASNAVAESKPVAVVVNVVAHHADHMSDECLDTMNDEIESGLAALKGK